MEVLVKAAVAEISKLVDDKCAFLHMEISRKQSENDALRRKLVLMESKAAQLQRGFENYIDRGSDAGHRPHPAGDLKFPEIEDETVSFSIKEESQDEALWISDTAEPVGAALQYGDSAGASAAEGQQFEEERQLSVSDVSRQKVLEFGDSYNPSGEVSGLQLTVKTEKDDNLSGFGQDGCQHGSGKQGQLPDFSLDERENQLWSSIIEGSDIDSSFPDFSSVVEEYSSNFAEHTDVSCAGKPLGMQQPSSHRPCNGVYSAEYQKEPESGFHPRPQGTFSRKEALYAQRNTSQVGHLRPEEHPERDVGAADGAAGAHSHGSFTQGSFAPHRPLSGAARGYVCSQCGKTFARLHQFKLHQQSHKRKRAFWCTVCGKSFQCSSHLSIHHRTHTGEKPYGCGQCGKRFTQQSSLRVHQRTHSGERPYSCAQCGKTFILMHHLKRHRIIHTYS